MPLREPLTMAAKDYTTFNAFWLRRCRPFTFIGIEGIRMAIEKITLQEINTLDQDHFVQALTPLFEGPPWIVTAAWYKRPFADLAQFQQTLSTIMYAAPVEQQVALLPSHPDPLTSKRRRDWIVSPLKRLRLSHN